MTNIPDGRHDAPSGKHQQKAAARDEVSERVEHGAGEAQAAVGESAGSPADGGAGRKTEQDDEKHARSNRDEPGGGSGR